MKKTVKKQDLQFAIIATDSVIFSIDKDDLKVALIPVHIPPFFENMKGLPGGLIAPDETADSSVFRHIQNKTGLTVSYIEQLYTFSGIDRDPRGRVLSVAYMAFISEESLKAHSSLDTVVWASAGKLPKLAYDHNEIVKKAVENLRSQIWHTKIAQYLLAAKFTLGEIQNVFEIVLKTKFDKRNFRKKLASLEVIKKVSGKKMEGAHRPAELYSFRK